jgi:hypothetical protein
VRIIPADIVKHKCSPGFVSTEHMLTGEADNQSHASTEHMSAGEVSDLRFASTEQELTGKGHNLSFASTRQDLTDKATLAGVPIPMDMFLRKMSGSQILVPRIMARVQCHGRKECTKKSFLQPWCPQRSREGSQDH